MSIRAHFPVSALEIQHFCCKLWKDREDYFMEDNSKENRNRALFAFFTFLAVSGAVILTALLMGCSFPSASLFAEEESLSYEKQKGVFIDAWGYPERITFYKRRGNERAVLISYDGDETVETAFHYDENSVLLWPVTSRTFSPIQFSEDERTFVVNDSTWELMDE
jgi:hypothetical protein